MKAALATQGGESCHMVKSSLENYEIIYVSLEAAVTKINPYRTEFTSNSKIIIANIFQDHTDCRYIKASTRQFKNILPSYLVPVVSTQINTVVLISWTFLGVGLLGFTTLEILHLFQRAEVKRYEHQNNKVLINKQ